MPSLQDFRRRIKSVKNTQQITKAMKMVAAAKLRRAQEGVQAARPYAEKIQATVLNLSGSEAAKLHPLLQPRKEQRIDLVIMTSDRGLCGAFNTNLIKRASRFLHQEKVGVEVTITSIGRKGNEYFRKRGYRVRKSHDGLMSRYAYDDVAAIAKEALQRFTSDECDAVYVAYMEFRSVLTQIPTVTRLLPFVSEGKDGGREGHEGRHGSPDYIFEPNVEQLLDGLLPRAINSRFYRFLLETSASEHGARMTAMDNATRNAKDVLHKLTLHMNRQRQANITRELIEIVSGAEAL